MGSGPKQTGPTRISPAVVSPQWPEATEPVVADPKRKADGAHQAAMSSRAPVPASV